MKTTLLPGSLRDDAVLASIDKDYLPRDVAILSPVIRLPIETIFTSLRDDSVLSAADKHYL